MRPEKTLRSFWMLFMILQTGRSLGLTAIVPGKIT